MAGKFALIIDDEPDITTYHEALLSDHGWRVQTANSGDESAVHMNILLGVKGQP